MESSEATESILVVVDPSHRGRWMVDKNNQEWDTVDELGRVQQRILDRKEQQAW